MQLHVNVNRSINGPALRKIGENTGFDSMGTQANISEELTKLFSKAAELEIIPKTILYSLNQNDWLELATLIGCFKVKAFNNCNWELVGGSMIQPKEWKTTRNFCFTKLTAQFCRNVDRFTELFKLSTS